MNPVNQSLKGWFIRKSENIPVEPDPGNAGAGTER
jgi:hypothetical protein